MTNGRIHSDGSAADRLTLPGMLEDGHWAGQGKKNGRGTVTSFDRGDQCVSGGAPSPDKRIGERAAVAATASLTVAAGAGVANEYYMLISSGLQSMDAMREMGMWMGILVLVLVFTMYVLNAQQRRSEERRDRQQSMLMEQVLTAVREMTGQMAALRERIHYESHYENEEPRTPPGGYRPKRKDSV